MVRSIVHSKALVRRLCGGVSSSMNRYATVLGNPSTSASSSLSGTTYNRSHASAATGVKSDAELKKSAEQQKQELKEEAAYLTKSLYRTCLRSVRLIRPGNKHDEEEFQRREEKRLEQETGGPSREEDARLGMFSMLPPVDREDELRSRAEYYHQYARENLVQEKDSLPFDDDDAGIVSLKEPHIARFMYFLRKGEKDRKWLLNDMMFPDPYENAFPSQRADAFEKKALAYVKEQEQHRRQLAGAPLYDQFLEDENIGDDDDDDDSDNDSDSDSEEYPAWFREKYPDMVPKRN